MTGIYIIKNLENSRIYVGSSFNYHKRVIKHLSGLNRNVHHNSKLQRAWNKYGKDQFKFEFLEEVEKELLLEREQYWIDLLDPFYNLSRTVGGHNRKATTEETKKKISDSKKNKKEVYKFDMYGNFIQQFNSITDGAKSVDRKNTAHIIQCCQGKRGYAYGYRWSYTPELILLMTSRAKAYIRNNINEI